MGDNFIDDGKASVMWIAWALLSRSSPSFATAAIDDPPRLINTRPVSKGLHALSKPPSFIYAASRVAKPEKLPKLAPSSESWVRRHLPRTGAGSRGPNLVSFYSRTHSTET